MIQLAILADDLTGAADAGSSFARVGLRTIIAFDSNCNAEADVIVRSTSSRGMNAAAAAAANSEAVAALLADGAVGTPRFVYKKIDSALRGHPGPELLAVMDRLGERRMVVAPALPAEGRTTVSGRHFVHGTLLHESELGAELENSEASVILTAGGIVAVESIHLDDVRKGVPHLRGRIASHESGVFIADAETDRDLALIARSVVDSDIRLLAGSAGLAQQLAFILAPTAVPPGWRQPALAKGPILVVAGSRNPVTELQVERLRETGVSIVHPSKAALDGAEGWLLATADLLDRHLAEDGAAVLTTSGMALARGGSAGVVAYLSRTVNVLAERGLIGGLVLTGGDVAAGIVAGLGASDIVLQGEVQPAIPWGMLHSRLLPEIPVVTKAGSFGDEHALVACCRFLQAAQ